MRSIQELRDDIAATLHEALHARDRQAGFYVSSTTAASRLFVEISPRNTLNITVVSPLFHGQDFDARNRQFWSLFGDGYSDTELDQVDFWQLLTMDEAKDFYPTFLGRKLSPEAETAHQREAA